MGLRKQDIEATGASLTGVAVTATFSQMAFAKHIQVGFPLLSDWGGHTAAAYGVRYDVWKGHQGLAKRSLFVIDPDGIIRYRWVTEDALILPDLDEPIGVLGELRPG